MQISLRQPPLRSSDPNTSLIFPPDSPHFPRSITFSDRRESIENREIKTRRDQRRREIGEKGESETTKDSDEGNLVIIRNGITCRDITVDECLFSFPFSPFGK